MMYRKLKTKKQTIKRILEVIFFTSIMPLLLNTQNPIIKNIFTSDARNGVTKF